MKPRIFTVPAGVPFLPALAGAILDGNLPAAGGPKPDPLALPDITLMLPTRRAARALQEAFLEKSGARALLSPRIRAIAEGDETSAFMSAMAEGLSPGADALDLPPAISPLERTLHLMELVRRWREAIASARPEDEAAGNNTPAQAAHLATELAGLMDEIERENVALSGLKDLVPDTYSEHWKLTLEFLKIVTEAWPLHLESNGQVSTVDRRNRLILAEARRVASSAPKGPVIVAGVTGSIPATVTLMRAVADLPNGAIVLPQLDLDLDDESWNRIVPAHPEHPQFGLKKLLDSLGVDRRDVSVLPGAEPDDTLKRRFAFISEAMRPAATTQQWHDYTQAADAALIEQTLKSVSLIEAPSSHDEAEAVALILRQAVDAPGRTAALVSPDRLLARRVAIRLEAWGIRVDDSAGRPFAKTVPGTFLDLVINAAMEDFAPAALMSLLKHPLCRMGLKAFDVRRYGRALEISAFRTPYLGKGLSGVAAALEKSERDRLEGERLHPAAKRLWDEDRAGADDLVTRLQTAFAPLEALYGKKEPRELREFADAHLAVAEALAALPADEADPQTDVNPLWQGEAGEAANTFFLAITSASMPSPLIRASEYADLYRSLLARENVRERTAVHPRVSIWGPFEARLQQPDVLILGSLNEGTWPEAAEPGAWLNRPMRQSLGLPSPEEDIGRAAHDFVSMLGASQVYLTRAQKTKGVPAVPSRWLMRIKALLSGLKLEAALAQDQPWLAWARARDDIDEANRMRIAAPGPCPPVSARPRRMSVSRVEEWITNPYAVFARSILKLEPLSDLGPAPDQSLRGALVHDVLSQFAVAYPNSLPNDLEASLKAIALGVLQDYTGHPRVAAFWMPRLERFLTWFAATEVDRRRSVSAVAAETTGTLVLAAPGGPFTLTARADRIDMHTSGLIITDYKTGAIPSNIAVESTKAPQLPLEAAIAISGEGFAGTSGRAVAALRYIRASGGEPPGEDRKIKLKTAADMVALAERAQKGLEALVAQFDDPTTPYKAIRRAGFSYDYDDYAHLARVAEWSAHDDDEGQS